MEANCKDCIQFKNLKEYILGVEDKVDKLSGTLDTFKERTTRNEEKNIQIFSILKDIKNSIDKFVAKLDEFESKPNVSEVKENIKELAAKVAKIDDRKINLLYTIAGGVIIAIILLVIK